MIELIFNSSVSMQMVAKSVSVKLRALGSTIPALLPLIKGSSNNAAGSAGSLRVFSSSVKISEL